MNVRGFVLSPIRFIGLLAFTGTLSIPSWSELPQTAGCLRSAEVEPTVVSNPESRVTFRCRNATSLDLIRAVGRQTRIPIGVVIGTDPAALLTIQHSYNLDRVDAKEALSKAIDGTGYSLKKEGPVFVLIAGDLSPRQRKLLTHQYDDFPSGTQSMSSLAAMLTMWMRAAINPEGGSLGSILGSTNDEQISVQIKHAATTEQIANQSVSQGSRGLWIFRVDASAPSDTSSDEINIEPYQYYSNSPLMEIRLRQWTTFSPPQHAAPAARCGLFLLRRSHFSHCTLLPGRTSAAVAHRSVEEIWYFLQGQGEVWRKFEHDEIVDPVRAGVCVTIPAHIHFQFRNTGEEPLTFVIATMPPWSGPNEAERVLDHWNPEN